MDGMDATAMTVEGNKGMEGKQTSVGWGNVKRVRWGRVAMEKETSKYWMTSKNDVNESK